MEVIGAVNWHDRSIRYDQENNIIETYLTKLKNNGQSTFRLESCGVEATACAIEAVGGTWKVHKESWEGYGDRMFDYLNSSKNAKKIPIDDLNIPNNEFIENLAHVGRLFSDCTINVEHYDTPMGIDFSMRSMLKTGSAIVLSYQTDYGSGHYITVVAWDQIKNIFYAYDPWAGNKHCRNGGSLEEYPIQFFTRRSRPRLMEVWR